MIEIKDLVADFESFMDNMQDAIEYSMQDVDFDNHRQWTAEQVETLERRGQLPVINNRIKPKLDLLAGLQRQTRGKPKALPRTPKHEKEADTATQAIRYVAENVDFEQTSSECFRSDLCAWGYEAAIIEPEETPKGVEIAVHRINADRLYFDPHSRALDFSDARFIGIVIWMDKAEAKAMFPDKADDIDAMLIGYNSGTEIFEDRPLWIDRRRNRIRVMQHYEYRDGQWWLVYFTRNLFLTEPKPSPLKDEDGRPDCPIVAQAAYIDLENQRYGVVRGDVWLQKEINSRHSKGLYLMNMRQTIGEEGAVDDINELKRQLARADGHAVVNPNFRFEILDTNDMTKWNVDMLLYAKQEIDLHGANAALGGSTGEKELSGRAIQALQQGGVSQISPIMDRHKHFERRVYRQIWNRVRQFWDSERWIRVTDDQDSLEWVGINKPVALGEYLQEQAQEGNQEAQSMLQELMRTQDPRLNQVVTIENPIAELDVDIILAESANYATIRQEQFDSMTQLVGAFGSTLSPDRAAKLFDAMLELSELPNKEQAMKLLEPEQDDPQQAQAQAELEGMVAEEQFNKMKLDNVLKEVEVMKGQQEVLQKQIETQKVATVPVENVSISI